MVSGGIPHAMLQNRLAWLTDATRAMPDKDWSHERGGTCVPGCSLFGRCHCEQRGVRCGKARIYRGFNDFKRGYYTGMPYVFRGGHFNKVFPATRQIQGPRWSRNGTPAKKLQPLVRYLHRRHGTYRRVGEAIDMTPSWLSMLARNGSGMVGPTTAKKIVAGVLALPRRSFDRYSWEELDTPPRPATEEDHLSAKRAAKAEQQINRMYGIRGNLTEREKRKRRTIMGDRW